MSYETSQERKEAIRYWVEEIRQSMDDNDFQRNFFESLADQFEERGNLSDKQMTCLKRTYERVTGG